MLPAPWDSLDGHRQWFKAGKGVSRASHRLPPPWIPPISQSENLKRMEGPGDIMTNYRAQRIVRSGWLSKCIPDGGWLRIKGGREESARPLPRAASEQSMDVSPERPLPCQRAQQRIQKLEIPALSWDYKVRSLVIQGRKKDVAAWVSSGC